MLKIVPAEDDESTHEADALAFWHGDGAVRLLRHDPARRAMLLERARPGHDAAMLSDDAIPTVIFDVARRLWRKPDANAPYDRIGDHVPAWLARAGESDLVPRAAALLNTLDIRHDVLVHGDFHHHNLLRDGERWVAIDPKPMLGEPEFDVVTFLWNPLDTSRTRERIETMIAAFAAQGLDAARIRAWAAIRATYLGLPVRPGMSATQVRVARMLLE